MEDNHGNDFTEIHSIKIFGSPVMGTDVAAIKGETNMPLSTVVYGNSGRINSTVNEVRDVR